MLRNRLASGFSARNKSGCGLALMHAQQMATNRVSTSGMEAAGVPNVASDVSL